MSVTNERQHCYWYDGNNETDEECDDGFPLTEIQFDSSHIQSDLQRSPHFSMDGDDGSHSRESKNMYDDISKGGGEGYEITRPSSNSYWSDVTLYYIAFVVMVCLGWFTAYFAW